MGTVEAAKAHFRRARLLGLPEILPPSFQPLYVLAVNGRFPPRPVERIRGKPDVIPEWLVDEIERAIRQS